MAENNYEKEVADLALFMCDHYLNQVQLRVSPEALLSENMRILLETIAMAIINKTKEVK